VILKYLTTVPGINFDTHSFKIDDRKLGFLLFDYRPSIWIYEIHENMFRSFILKTPPTPIGEVLSVSYNGKVVIIATNPYIHFYTLDGNYITTEVLPTDDDVDTIVSSIDHGTTAVITDNGIAYLLDDFVFREIGKFKIPTMHSSYAICRDKLYRVGGFVSVTIPNTCVERMNFLGETRVLTDKLLSTHDSCVVLQNKELVIMDIAESLNDFMLSSALLVNVDEDTNPSVLEYQIQYVPLPFSSSGYKIHSLGVDNHFLIYGGSGHFKDKIFTISLDST